VNVTREIPKWWVGKLASKQAWYFYTCVCEGKLRWLVEFCVSVRQMW
jgi:hypothetical protein